MRHPLETRIAALRGQVRRLLAAHGLAWSILGAVSAVVAAGLLDFFVHFVPEVRLALLLGVVAGSAWLFWRYVVVPLIVRFDDLDIALRIERRWPGLNDRLASTIQFLRKPDDDALGSKPLRDATIAQTIDETKAIDFRQAVDPRPARKAMTWSGAALSVAVLFLLIVPLSSRIALDRLFRPFGATQWPRLTHLSIVESETAKKVAKGDSYTLAVAVGQGEHMPSSAKAMYLFADGETAEEALRPADDGVFRGRLETVNRDFSFTVAAGDDQTAPWSVKAVPPPALANLTVKIVPPPYTKLGPETLGPGNTQVRAVFGSKIELTAKSTKPLASATVRIGDGQSKDPVKLSPNGLEIAASFPAGATVPFWFELKDTEGFKNQEIVRYDLRSVADEAPRVVIEEPANDRDVPASATVPVQIAVDDDYGLHSIRMIYKLATGGSEPAREVVLPFFDGQAKPDAPPSKHEVVTYRWDLAPLKLQPGAIVSFHADARDFDNVKGPNIGKSRELRLRIVSDEEIGRQLEDQQRAIRDAVERTLQMQKQAQQPVDDALRTFKKTPKLPDPVRDNLKNAETIQRQVTSGFTSKSDGLDTKIKKYLDDLNNFNVPNADAKRQMLAMKASVERIKDKNLTPAEQALARAGKALDGRVDADAANKPQPGAHGQDPSQAPSPSKPSPSNAGPQSEPQSKSTPSKPESGAQTPGDETKPSPNGPDAKGASEAKPSNETKPSPNGQNSKPGDQTKPSQPGSNSKPGSETKPSGFEAKSSPELALNDAGKNQQEIADELKKMLDSMSEFDTYRGVVKDAKSLLQQQEQALKQSAEAASKPESAKKLDDLTDEQKAELDNLKARQAELAKNLQNLEAKMDEMAKKVEAADPLAAAALRDAAKQSRKRSTAAKMNEGAEQLGKNQMGQARQNQEQARNDLKDLVDSVQNRRERELARLVQELKKAEADLKALRNRQAANLKKTAAAKKMADSKARTQELQKLAKEQAQIQEELKRQLQKLAKLNAESAGQKGEQAAGQMSKAQEDLNQDQGEQAEAEMEEALDNLRQAQRELAQNRRDAEEQLAMEQIAKMADQLKAIAERQEKMVGQTSGYEEARNQTAGKKLTIAQRTGVRDLGRIQGGLRDETGELLERIGEGAPVFSLTLKRASASMTDAADRLQALKTDGPTLTAERSASRRFKQLLDSLKPDKMKKADGGDDQQQGGGGGGAGGDGIPPAAQIKMLKMLQQEINERTDAFDELVRRKKKLMPEQERERTMLKEDQGTLADLVRDMTRPKTADGED